MTADPLAELLATAITESKSPMGCTVAGAAPIADWLRAHRNELLEALDGERALDYDTCVARYGMRRWGVYCSWFHPGDELWTFIKEGNK